MKGEQIEKMQSNALEALTIDKGTAMYWLKKFSKRCPRITQALIKQLKGKGACKEDWSKIISFLVAAEAEELAIFFSALSKKHDKSSLDRIEEMIQDKISNSNNMGMVRCTTFGCSKNQILKCFDKLNRNDNKEITNSPGNLIDHITRVTPPKEKIYRKYLADLLKQKDFDLDEEGNLCTYTSDGKIKPVSNFIARITKEIVKTDGESIEKSVIVEGILSGGKTLNPIEIQAEEFGKFDWTISRWGTSAAIKAGNGNKDKVREVTQMLNSNPEIEQIFKHLGWNRLEDGRLVYLHHDGAIGADGISVDLNDEMKLYSLPGNVKDLKKAIKLSVKLLHIAPMEVMIVLLGLTFLSPLVQFLQKADVKPNFVVWLHGLTGSRKTTIALLVLSHFGKFVSSSPPASFKDTANAVEVKSFIAKDSLLLIDDYHPQSSEGEAGKMESTAERVLRMWGDRIGRRRLNSKIELQKTYYPRGMVLVTGEDLPSGQSSNARLVEIELPKDSVNLEKLTLLQNNCLLLSESMTGYIQWIIEQEDKLSDKLKQEFEALRARYQKGEVHGRISEAIACLNIGFSMFLKYAIENEAITEEKRKRLQIKAQKVFTNMIKKQSENTKLQNLSEVFTNVLKELINSDKVSLKNINSPENESSTLGSGEFIGYYDAECYYLFPEITYNLVNSFLAKRKARISLTTKTLWKHLDVAGIIKTEIGAGTTFQRIPKKTVKEGGRTKRIRLLHVYRSKIDELEE